MSDIDALRRRVAELEDCLAELVPFGDAYDMNLSTVFHHATQEGARAREHKFHRDTLHIDQHVFRRIKKLMETRVS